MPSWCPGLAQAARELVFLAEARRRSGAPAAEVRPLVHEAATVAESIDRCSHRRHRATAPDVLRAFVTDVVRPVGTYGRCMCDTMAAWKTNATLAAQSELLADIANVR